MIQIHIDEEYIDRLLKEEIRQQVERTAQQQTFWNTDDLKRHTRLSWNTIQDTFFHHPDFPKTKVGGKWLYPAEEAQAFLLRWLNEQR